MTRVVTARVSVDAFTEPPLLPPNAAVAGVVLPPVTGPDKKLKLSLK